MLASADLSLHEYIWCVEFLLLRVLVGAGSALAVGISCANTGMQSALDLLEPLRADSVDFVRQGALIATSLVLMQQPEPKVTPLLSFCCQSYSWLHVVCYCAKILMLSYALYIAYTSTSH